MTMLSIGNVGRVLFISVDGYKSNNRFLFIEHPPVRHTHYNWLRGQDDSGNIKKIENIKKFCQTTMQQLRDRRWLPDLVTADGSVDSQFDANEQEAITASLHFAEYGLLGSM